MKKLFLCVLIFGGALLVFHFKDKSQLEISQEIRSWIGAKKKYAPGILAKQPPMITKISAPKTWEKNGFKLTGRAGFNMKARLLGKWVDMQSSEFYRQLHPLSRITACVGWGPASDQRVVDTVNFAIKDGFYFWAPTMDYPADLYPTGQVSASMAYLFLIAEPAVEEQIIRAAKPGDMIQLNGRLIDFQSADGRWGEASPLDGDYSDQKIFRYVWVDSMEVL